MHHVGVAKAGLTHRDVLGIDVLHPKLHAQVEDMNQETRPFWVLHN